MGRNVIPKLGEWRDGRLYQFRVLPHLTSTRPEHNDNIPRTDDGRMIVYERINAPYIVKEGQPVEETLATCYADGFQECMAAMYTSGYNRGLREGREQALRSVRGALGIEQG